MFFVYSTQSQKVYEYKDLNSFLEGCQKSHAMGDLFWTLGLKSWISISEVITNNILKQRKLDLPPIPGAEITEVIYAPPVMESLKPAAPPTVQAPKPAASAPTPPPPPTKAEPIKVVKPEEEFKIISYEPPVPTESQKTQPAKPINQRKFPRYTIRLKVIISNKEKTFLSYTSNVSIGGVALEDNIPAEYFNESKDSEIFISSPKKNEFLAFRCTPVGDETDPKRFSFGQISEESLNKFQDWIDKLKT